VLDPGLQAANPLDLWGIGRGWQRVYETCLTAMADDPATGVLVLAVDLVRGSRLVPDYVDIVARVHDATRVAVVVLGNLASAIDPAAAARLRERDIPVLMGTETGLLALRHALSWQPATPRRPLPADDIEQAKRYAPLLIGRQQPMTEFEAKQLLAAWSIPVIAEWLVHDEVAAVEAARALGWPVVLKTGAAGVLHKTDVRGVILDVESEAAVQAGYQDLRQRLGTDVLVQRQIAASERVELFLGMTVDTQFGPLVTFGLGGIWVEALSDVVVAMPPIDEETAHRLMLGLRGASVLSGSRGRNSIDVDAVAEAIAAFSRMATALGPYLTEIDVNPLIATSDGVVAVDALIVPRAAVREPQP
jgi:acyl-CoA synthetase (NDP forming)